jgi:transcriptional regulator with XRE-family HTH domain
MKAEVSRPARARVTSRDPSPRTLEITIGERLRAARQDRRLSLAELAAASGRSIGHLSQIERGLSSPTVREVAMLAEVLGIDFLRLLTAPAASSEPSPIRRHADQPSIPFRGSGIVKRVLAPANAGAIQFYGMRISPGGTTGEQPYAHDGEEAGVVMSGSIVLRIGDAEHRLEAGDSFRFSSAVPHAFRNAGRTTAQVVWINVGGTKGVPLRPSSPTTSPPRTSKSTPTAPGSRRTRSRGPAPAAAARPRTRPPAASCAHLVAEVGDDHLGVAANRGGLAGHDHASVDHAPASGA